MRYFIGSLTVLLIGMSVFAAISLAGDDVFSGEKEKLELFNKRLGLIGSVVLWWPTWALVLKRLHDLGLGLLVLLPFVTVDLVTQALDIYGYDDLSWQFSVLEWGAMLMLALVKGPDGPNRYGPDPLAGTQTAAKASV